MVTYRRLTIALVSVSVTLAACTPSSGHGGTSTYAPPTFSTPSSSPTSAVPDALPDSPAPAPDGTVTITVSPTVEPSSAVQTGPPDPNQGANQLGQGESAIFNGSANGGTNIDDTVNYLTDVVHSVYGVWADWFQRANFAFTQPGYYIVRPGGSLQTECTYVSPVWTADTQNAQFCDKDTFYQGTAGTIEFPADTMQSMWSGNIFQQQSGKVGDFAAGIIVAHEFGHDVAYNLQNDFSVSQPRPPDNELLADCFAGVWAYVAFSQGLANRDDLQDAVAALGVIGDTQGSHGTDAQRVNALEIGMLGSQANQTPALPSNCTTAFWPSLGMR